MAVNLYIETTGNGPDLALLHGWGLHGGLWKGVAEALAEHYRVHCIDLPGHGRSAMIDGSYTVETLASAVASQVPADAHWVGWSLGGMVALQAAASGVRIGKLVLIGASPRFVQGENWPHAIPVEVLENFAEELGNDYRATLMRFLALQARGSERAREELRRLRDEVFAHGEPKAAALAGGLEILRRADLRHTLEDINQPTTLIQGQRDTLVPLGAAMETVQKLPMGNLHIITGAGHAPFISHPDEFIAALTRALYE